MEESDQVEVDEAEIGQPLTSERNSSSESDCEEVVKSFTKLSIYPPISTISVKKREVLEKLLKKYKENKENFFGCTKELMGVSSILRGDIILSETYNHVLYHKPIEGDAVSLEKYIQLLQEKFKNADITRNHYEIRLPRDIDLAKESSKYSVKEIEILHISIGKLNENELECLQKFLKSFECTQIDFLKLERSRIYSNIKKFVSRKKYCDSFLKVYPCSNFFEELSYVASRATNRIDICRLELSSKEFIQLVKAAKKVKYLTFFDCKISFDSEFDFGPMEGCLIEEVFISYNNQVYDEWSDYVESLMNIFCGILKCTNLVRSLKGLNFKYTNSLKEKLIKTAKEILGEDYSEIMPSLRYR